MTASARPGRITRAAGIGAAAGLAGAAAMVITEKVEQSITRRPDSYVPGRALLTLLGRRPRPDARPTGWNHLMHFGTGAALGAVRGIWSVTGIRGPLATAWHTVIRLGFDQTIENATGVGAPPKIWPAQEKAVDLLHKTVFSVVTGLVTDRVLPPSLISREGAKSH